jgi:hypothetical protein
MLTADVEAYFPVTTARSGGVAAMGNAFMERLDADSSPDGVPMIRLVGRQAPTQGVWWFPRHQQVKPEETLPGDARARLVVDVEAASPVTTALSLQWRIGEQAGDAVRAEPQAVGPDNTTRFELPVPVLAPDAVVGGIILGFSVPADYRIRRLALARQCLVLLDDVRDDSLRRSPQATLTGRAAAGIGRVVVRLTPQDATAPALAKAVDARDGRFELVLAGSELRSGVAYLATAEPADRPLEASPGRRLFAYPPLTGRACPPVRRQGPDLIREGKRFGFVGVNYTPFYLGLTIRADYESLARHALQMRDWGVRVVRVPLDIGAVQPALGILPDQPGHAALLRKHRLDPAFVEQLDYFVAVAGELGIYTLIDWHGIALDPYRYFLGGQEQDRGSGKPGTAIAYLAPSPTERGEFDLADAKHVEALLNAHRWAARHFRGNPNLLGIEVPFNEPHTKYMAVEANWRTITDLAARAVAEGDPDRLTFALGPSYSHNNLLPSVTWLPPDRVTGGGHHFYQANGPVPTRADAATFREPWLARETEGTFGWSFPAVMLPFSAVDYPAYNGECGAHGARMVLPNLPAPEAAMVLIEAQLVQEYAAGMVGRLEWTLWDNANDFVPYLEVYRTLFRRFAPVFEAGPLDRMAAAVAFVQHPEAVPSSNGHNFACLPFAKAALDLHLSPVHYLTDEQLRYRASAELSVGLEQVVGSVESLGYKALVVDRRHLDPRTAALLPHMGVPLLWLDDAEALTADALAVFLKQSGVAVDTGTPREIQLAEGPDHLVVYRRLDGGANPVRIHPLLKRAGSVALIGEDGKTAYQGDAAQLATTGFEVDLPLWRSAIYRIEGR